jgi:hypothetical protein
MLPDAKSLTACGVDDMRRRPTPIRHRTILRPRQREVSGEDVTSFVTQIGVTPAVPGGWWVVGGVNVFAEGAASRTRLLCPAHHANPIA